MDDNCAVCADTLEWVAYGACGHREVCSTCVVRLRFICQDRRCCICKTESDVVFITRALGEYTTLIKDFSRLPSQVKEGRVGSSSYWYHEDSQAFFDDSDHYKTIKAMCKPSCRECDFPIRSVSQLKNHLERQHKLFMCSQCLKGRKVFICEQKLYTSIAQLNRHIASGDSKVDGSESERGGFRGHPMCQFCRTGFYGESELYTHMSTQHYTCHICQRQNPGKYEYYKNYDDLEMHFRRRHFLCEDESCLAQKFVVFQSEAEMKRHSLEHEGPMPRSKRNAALQIPTSFRYQHEPDHRLGRGGRGQTFLRESFENQASMEIQASSETSNIGPSSSSGQVAANAGDRSDTIDPIVDEFESLSTTDGETSNRYRQALQNSCRSAPLAQSSFPSLVSGSSQSNPKNESYGLPNTITMAAHLRRQNNRNVATNAPAVQPASSAEAWPTMNASAHLRKLPSTSPALPKVENHVQAANKALVEKIRAALEYDEDKYTTFKDISGQYRQGLVHTEVYLDFVQQFGLMHLVLDLAVLCPDAQKQRELIGAYNNIVRNKNGAQENGRSQSSARMKDTSSSKKGKAKISKAENSNSKKALADSIMSSVMVRRKC